MPEDADIDELVDELYGLEPDRFVESRTRMERGLRAEGRRAEAATLKSLGRPTLAAWALNQVVRRRPEAVADLAAADEELRRAQERSVRTGSAGELREADRRRREIAGRLLDAAAEILGERIADPGAHARELDATLAATTTDPELAAQLRRGRLVRASAAPATFGFGFDLDAAVEPAPLDAAVEPAPPPPGPEEREAGTGRDRERRRARAAAERAVRTAEREAAEAGEQLRAARAEVEAARRGTEGALAEVERAREALAAAERELERARAGQQHAEQRAGAAERAAADAERALADAQGRLEGR